MRDIIVNRDSVSTTQAKRFFGRQINLQKKQQEHFKNEKNFTKALIWSFCINVSSEKLVRNEFRGKKIQLKIAEIAKIGQKRQI